LLNGLAVHSRASKMKEVRYVVALLRDVNGNGEEYLFSTFREAAAQLGVSVQKVARNVGREVNGYKIERTDKFIQWNEEGDIIAYNI
jgi:hypothetical protein